jgi:hypothetical protein
MEDMTASDSDVAASRAAIVKPRRPSQTFADMARSLGLMAVVIAALLLLGPARTLVFPGGAERDAVDYSQPLQAFERFTPHALAPQGLPTQWRANAVSFTPASGSQALRLHVGWATPGELFVGLDESTGSPAALVRAVLGRRGAAVSGQIQLAGLTWQHRVSDRGEDAYTATTGDVTAVVTGNGTPTQLRTLLAALREVGARGASTG